MIQLNEGQQRAHDQLVEYLVGRDTSKTMWLLKGYAGTGKTTTIGLVLATVMQAYRDKNRFFTPAIAVSAPTHKAVSVLKRANMLGSEVTYATIHSLLGLKEVINPMTGKQEFKQDNNPKELRIESFNILILDEVSMLSNELFDLLVPYVRDGLKLVMMGDPVQIPPINEGDPVPFTEKGVHDYNIGVMELTEIVRQAADNPILAYATEIRKVYKSGNPVPRTMLNAASGTGIEILMNSETIMDVLKEEFTGEAFSHNPDHMKVIAWTNATVNKYNDLIRKLIYGPALQGVMIGEKLVADNPVLDPDKGTTIIMHNNQECEVLEYTIYEKTLSFQTSPISIDDDGLRSGTFKYYDTLVEYEEMIDGQLLKRRARIHLVHEDSQQEFRNMQEMHKRFIMQVKDMYRKKDLWKWFYNNERKFASMKYNYAITAHKSQGSTYNKTMVMEWDINKNNHPKKTEERNRIKYVAATRPRQKLYIVK